MLTPAESGSFIASKAKDVTIKYKGIEKCAKDIVVFSLMETRPTF